MTCILQRHFFGDRIGHAKPPGISQGNSQGNAWNGLFSINTSQLVGALFRKEILDASNY